MTDPVRVAIIGYGFMGPTHARAYQLAARAGHPCRLVAICDHHARQRVRASPGGNLETGAGAVDLSGVELLDDPGVLLARADVDLVSICTPTDTHVALAIDALEAGKHVLVEKPVALFAPQVERLARRAARARTLCMPAMCMRYWPAWAWIRRTIEDRRFGRARSIALQRLGTRPAWAPAFYGDESRCGGVLVDLHIHDADFLHFCFGSPRRVRVAGDRDHLTAIYDYRGRPIHATAEAAWDQDPAAPFTMRCAVTFEGATVEFDLGRDPELLVHAGGETTSPELEPISGYDAEIRALIDAIASGRDRPPTTMDDAVSVARLIDAERRSLETQEPAEIG